MADSDSDDGQGSSQCAETADFEAIVGALGPIETWSSSTISSLKAAVNDKYPEADWDEDSEWTERAIEAILSPNPGWDRQKLIRCSNAKYFSLPTHTIALLNDLYYSQALDEVDARVEEGDYDAPLGLVPQGDLYECGYPIFRVDYSDEERFQLYKLCWDRFLEKQFYRSEALDREGIKWYWIEDKQRLDRKGPREVQSLFHAIKGQAFPRALGGRWFCLMVDGEAIESMLRVYGPRVTRISQPHALEPFESYLTFLPYLVAVSTKPADFETEGEDSYRQREAEPDDGKYHGYLKVAFQNIFGFWESEQLQSPEEYYVGRDSIWGDTMMVYRHRKRRGGR